MPVDNRNRFLTLGISVLMVACEGAQQDQPAFDEEEWIVPAEPTVVIGGSDEREGYLLQQVVGATRLGDGRIVIADGGSAEISIYDSLGTHLVTVGGKGEGPGEFRGIQQVQRLSGDTLLVLSRRPGLTWLSPEGQYVRSERFSLGEAAQLPCRLLGYWNVLGDGSLVTALGDNFGLSGCPNTPASPWRESGLIVRSTHYDGQFDTLGLLPALERNSPYPRVYGRSLVLGFGPDRIYAGDTGAAEILVLSFSGDTLLAYSTPFEAAPIPREAKREDARQVTLPDGTERFVQHYLYPETYPRFGRLLADEVGFLWVMAYPRCVEADLCRLDWLPRFVVEEGGARWRVLGSDGQVTTEVRTPPGLFPLEIGEDYILGVSKDEFDVQAVQLHALVR